MRVLAALLALSIWVPAMVAHAGDLSAQSGLGHKSPSDCRTTGSDPAARANAYSDAPLTPRKLTELPPGVTYMAVYRKIGGCEAPLTMAQYRGGGRR